ncbi:hypothetical protein B0T24DRAFT_706072 [Lasiosphaeria ovina]|uniref:Uncharacterized protein n=1 Tax=Lasiosphaeria ovina TaxID=92902 RepID=A0AAE0N5R4_9PEZI|nr:hypothetical protein B0T24DRAFT_706072 [Lasiosphaeria ovina]
MQLPSALALLASALGFTTALNLPDGAWEGTTLANGRHLVKAAGAADSEAFVYEPTGSTATQKRGGAAVAKRTVGCFGYQLDTSGVDRSAEALRKWAGSGGHTLTSGKGNNWYAVVVEETIVYYCIDAPNSSGNLDVNDVNYALGQMDATCRPYEASYFNWPGSVEIVGKGRKGDNICV